MADHNPEKLLLAAVLIRAIRDLVLYSRGRSPEEQRFADSAREWIFEEPEDRAHIASFQSICLAMGLDHDLVRERIRKLQPDRKKTPISGLWSYLR